MPAEIKKTARKTLKGRLREVDTERSRDGQRECHRLSLDYDDTSMNDCVGVKPPLVIEGPMFPRAQQYILLTHSHILYIETLQLMYDRFILNQCKKTKLKLKESARD